MVLKMFEQIDELAEDTKCLVIVLIDEVGMLSYLLWQLALH